MAEVAGRTGPNVEFVREEVVNLLPIYKMIRDVISLNIKDQGEVYLPFPGDIPLSDRTEEDRLRYRNYVARATFSDFTGRSLSGFVGKVFSRDPEMVFPDSLAKMVQDVNGEGLDLVQLAKSCVTECLSVGRGGLLTDYPAISGGATRAQILSGEIRPTINLYKTEDIINWATKVRNGIKYYKLWVLRETYEKDNDGFESQYDDQYRILELVDFEGRDVYRVRVWRKEDGFADRDAYPLINGKNPDYIPFIPFGAKDNDATPDAPPLRGMAETNIAHYHNSADYEESVFLVGQPTLSIIGITKTWLEKTLGGVVRFGSRNGLTLEKDSKVEIVQAQPNTLVGEAMEKKEKQMAAQGADFLKEQVVRRTATEADIDDSSKSSTISNAAKNVTAAIQFALECAALFQGESETSVKFKLNAEFDLTRMSYQDRQQMSSEYEKGLLSWTEVRSALHKAGIATQEDELAKSEIEQEEAARIEKAAAEFAATQPKIIDENEE